MSVWNHAASSSRRLTLEALARRWALLLLLAAGWELVSRLRLIDPLLLPPPSQVLARGYALLMRGPLLAHLIASTWRVLLGFGAAWLVAVPLGIALGLSQTLEQVFRLPLSLLRPLSPPAWVPLAILWFGIGDAPAVFIIFVGTLFSLLVGTRAAIKGVDPQLIKAGLTLGASHNQALRHVILPSLLPALLAQARLGFGLAWMCVIAAEMVAVRRGVGFMMIEARSLFRTEDVLVGMLAIGLLGVGLDGLLLAVESRLCGWREGLDPSLVYAREPDRL